jgi:hypothetical protein
MTGWIPLEPSTPAYLHTCDVEKKYREKVPAISPFFPFTTGRSPRTTYLIIEGFGIVADFEQL